MQFISDGFHIPSNYSGFPYLLLCERKREQLDNEDDFFIRYIDKYYRTDESVEFGSGSKAVISDIRVTLKGIELMFTPLDASDPAYKGWPMPLPQVKTSYVGGREQFVITFHETEFDEGNLKQKLKAANSNNFIESVELLKEAEDAKVLINLKSAAKFYHAKESRLFEDGFPILLFDFSQDVADQNY